VEPGTLPGTACDLRAGYGRAAERGEEICHDLVIGPWRLRVMFASGRLACALTPPLTRLLADPASAALATIRVWDTASTGAQPPPIPVEVEGDARDDRFRVEYRTGSISLFDCSARTGYIWFADPAQIDWYERAEPLRPAIHWALTTDRRYLAHASGVGDDRGAVVLTGKGGAGKTTTTLASIDAGLSFIGDNYVLLSLEGRQPVVHGIYGNAKVWPQTLQQLPGLKPYVKSWDVGPDEKLVLEIARHRPESLATGLPVRAVVVPEVVGGGDARITPCSPAQAMLALAPTTVLQLPLTGFGLDGMAELLRRVPTYRLELGRDVMGGPRLLSTLLDELAG